MQLPGKAKLQLVVCPLRAETAPQAGGPWRLQIDAADSHSGAAWCGGRSVVYSAGKGRRRENLERLGVVEALACPMTTEGETLGVLEVYQFHPRPYADEDAAAVEAIAHIAASSLARCRAERRLATQTRLVESLRDSMESLMMVLAGDGTITTMNDACRRASGFTAGGTSRPHRLECVDAAGKRSTWCGGPVARLEAGSDIEQFRSLSADQVGPAPADRLVV